ncbi:hypothetical protein D1872_244060 [compost metagenome]
MRDPEAAANQTFGSWFQINADENNFTPAPRSAQGDVPIPGFQPLVHVIGDFTKGQLAKCDQIADLKKGFQRLVNLFSGIYFSCAHSLLQHLRCNIDKLDFIRHL